VGDFSKINPLDSFQQESVNITSDKETNSTPGDKQFNALADSIDFQTSNKRSINRLTSENQWKNHNFR